MTTPARASDHCTSPEQSNTFGPLPPHTYGSPSLLSAAVRNAITSAPLSPRPSAGAGPPVPQPGASNPVGPVPAPPVRRPDPALGGRKDRDPLARAQPGAVGGAAPGGAGGARPGDARPGRARGRGGGRGRRLGHQ